LNKVVSIPEVQDSHYSQGGVNKISTTLLIPAYDKNSNGVVVKILIDAYRKPQLKIEPKCSVSIAISKMFLRTIEIMSSLNKDWESLCYFEYSLKSESSNFLVKDARSSGLPISIVLLNILRKYNGLNEKKSLIGTGILRVDGTFDESSLEHIKQRAVLNSVSNRCFIDSKRCNHLFDLNGFINNQ